MFTWFVFILILLTLTTHRPATQWVPQLAAGLFLVSQVFRYLIIPILEALVSRLPSLEILSTIVAMVVVVSETPMANSVFRNAYAGSKGAYESCGQHALDYYHQVVEGYRFLLHGI